MLAQYPNKAEEEFARAFEQHTKLLKARYDSAIATDAFTTQDYFLVAKVIFKLSGENVQILSPAAQIIYKTIRGMNGL